MTQNPTTEQHVPDCCYCDKPPGDQAITTHGGSLIHESCLEQVQIEQDQHREEDEPQASIEEPTDEDWDACLQAHYGYGQGRMSI